MILVAVFVVLLNLAFVQDLSFFSGVSLEGLKYLLVLYIAILHLTLSPEDNTDPLVGSSLNLVKTYIAILTLSLIFSISPQYTLRSLVPWVSIFLVLLAIIRNLNVYREQLEWVFSKAVILGLVISVINITLAFASNQAFVIDDSGISRIAFLKTIPYWYAQTIAMAGFVYYYNWRNNFRKLSLVMALLIFTFLVLSGIRTYYIAFIVSIFIVEAFSVSTSSIKKTGVFIFLCSVAIAIFVYYEPFRTKMFLNEPSTLSEIVSNIRLSDRDKIAVYLISNSYNYSGLITGTGAGTAKFILERDKVFDNTVVSHSDYIRIITEFGILGLMVYAILLLYWIKHAIHVVACSSLKSKSYACAYASSVCFIAIGGIAYDLFTPVNVFFAYILYLLSTNVRRQESNRMKAVDLSFSAGSFK